jgi:hypothetical protein
MENYLFFADADGVDATGDAGLYPVSKFIGIQPITATTTGVYFAGGTGVGDAPELVTLTHLNSATVLDDQADINGHKCQDIAKAIVRAMNAHPHSGGKIIDIVDLTNKKYAEGLSGLVTGVAITIDA